MSGPADPRRGRTSHLNEWLADNLAQRAAEGLLRSRRQFRPFSGDCCEVDGQRVRNFASNDYLNLARHPRVIAAAQTVLAAAGVGATASALVCGRTVWHERLEQALAEWEGTAAAVLFPTGLAANLGTVSALVGPDDVVYCDRFNHASLVDGCRLSGARLRVYRHDRLEALERDLRKGAAARRRWIVTDAVFSMEGDLAPLPELCGLAERFDAGVIVDEAHATGVFGAQGRGVCEHFGLLDRVAVRIGTLSKALGAMGGFVCGPQTLIDYLWNTARSQMYSTALPPAICAAALEAVIILRETPELVRMLSARAAEFRAALRSRGVEPLAGSQGPIVPIVLGDAAHTVAIAADLAARGYWVGAIRPPTVPRGTSRLRISISLAHAPTTLMELADALAEVLHSPRR
uniref:8-amino-7-ketopelargonate synthase n=1 Tax=Schlesneria paludicola TaxID=360056 RepID=A0A7C4LM56_9PLAN